MRESSCSKNSCVFIHPPLETPYYEEQTCSGKFHLVLGRHCSRSRFGVLGHFRDCRLADQVEFRLVLPFCNLPRLVLNPAIQVKNYDHGKEKLRDGSKQVFPRKRASDTLL